jgi:hypothetical protein
VRERGRMRKRGPRGGGTLRRKSPQQGQRPSVPRGVVISARSQWPRASHCGLMHCTVKPGKNCIFSPPEATSSRRFRNDRWRSRLKRFRAPLGGQDSLRKKRRESPSRKTLRTSNRDGGDCGASKVWCQEKRLQDIVVRLREGVAVDPWLNQQAVFLSGQSRSKRSS